MFDVVINYLLFVKRIDHHVVVSIIHQRMEQTCLLLIVVRYSVRDTDNLWRREKETQSVFDIM